MRAEVIVSFGHSTANKPSAQNVDINGNGVIDADEAWVRSVPARLGLTVPAEQTDNGTLTIQDVASNITTTGDVTFSNPQFNLGATSGTVTLSYNGGASGGKITNCATGAGSATTVTVGGFTFPVDGSVGLQACDTQDIGATPPCTEGAAGCGWSNGDLTTYPQAAWGMGGSADNILQNNYAAVYASVNYIFLIGSASGFTAQWTDSSILGKYMPAGGTAAALDANTVDATSTSSGIFGGNVAALKLNVDFGDVGILTGSTTLKFGDLTLCGLTTLAGLNGTTVRGFLGVANMALGGGSAGYSISDLNVVAAQLDAAFSGGTVSTFAQTSLVNGSCGWKDGDVVTYTQDGWDGGTLLTDANFKSVYGSDFEIGTESNFYVVFTTAANLLDFVPQFGTPVHALNTIAVDPSSTAAGAFAGEMAALTLNVDFADHDLITGNAGVKLGDLTICALSVTALNGMTVRTFLSNANTVLGGLSGAASIDDTYDTVLNINASFSSGASNWAKAHLFNGACP